MSTPTWRVDGAFPLTPLTVMLLVTAEPKSGIATSVAFSKYLVPGGPVVGGAVVGGLVVGGVVVGGAVVGGRVVGGVEVHGASVPVTATAVHAFWTAWYSTLQRPYGAAVA